LLISLGICKNYFSKEKTMSSNRIALVTGANKGLGLETCRQLAQKGIVVLMGSRDAVRGKAAEKNLKDEGLRAAFVQLDVTNSQQIRAVKDYIEKEFGKLDILVNNAGMLSPDESLYANSVETVPLKAIRETFDVNFFGMIELTQALLPLIKKSDAGRIVNIASVLGSLTLHSDESSMFYQVKPFAYNVSKTAVNQFTVHLAAALINTPIKVNSAHPGWVKTDMGTDQAPMDVQEGARTAVRLATLGPDGPNGRFIHFEEELPW
jgi:NAD(P)-dependent dehydrogenase (short-subunit alcohol dehydrogenase family)